MVRIFVRTLSCLVAVASFAASASAQGIPNAYTTQQSDLPCVEKRFSLFVHLNATSEGAQEFDRAAFESMLELTNAWFDPICVAFDVCAYDTVANYRYESLEATDADELVAQFGDRRIIDVFVPRADTTRDDCSLASTDSLSALADSTFVTVLGECVSPTSKALAQELGHYFGLLHTFSGGDELVSGDNCATAGDRICDTPADPYTAALDSTMQLVDNENPCTFVYRGQDEQGRYYVPHTANVMSYYADECACGFTHDQLERMAGRAERVAERLW